VATQVGLGGPTLVRLMPHDGVGARAIAEWLASAGIDDALVVHDHDDDYGVPVGEMCVAALRKRGIAVRGRRVWDAEERPADDLETAGAIVYAGVAGSGAVGLWQDLHAARPDAWLIGTEGVAAPFLARGMSASAAARTRFFVANRAPPAFYGFEAMRLVLDAADAGAGDRAAVARAARATRDRDSVLGRYSLDADGHTTLAYGRPAVVDGGLVWDLATARR